MTAVASSQGADQIGGITALTDGYSAAFLGAAGIAVAGALLAAVLPRIPHATGTAASEMPGETREPTAAGSERTVGGNSADRPLLARTVAAVLLPCGRVGQLLAVRQHDLGRSPASAAASARLPR
jgi:hypothetical protein